ncbi:hypothetical protein MXD59_19395 [Frankia sp. Ag45/Mut15]|uniref:UGSC-like domain-containing protein n=1 Tax=Frankia umida TaxID=573489 RepID=A0ABT0K337_9ACTN|nr:hypothetical protein [Frankia umida]MCK9877914.1 hypothetical protein [Frankia umida]
MSTPRPADTSEPTQAGIPAGTDDPRGSVDRAVAQLAALLGGDSGALTVTEVDPACGTVRLALSLDDVDCADCVLPPDRLYDVVRSQLDAAVPGLRAVTLEDPRLSAPTTNTPTTSSPATGGTITVLDPTCGAAPGDPDPGPDLGPLAGRRIGFRIDVLWPAWDQTVDEWTTTLERAGATVTSWRRAQGLKGAAGASTQAEYDAFVGGVDAVVSGLANCGSCTSWSVRDGLSGLEKGLPTVVAVTERFVGLAGVLAADNGRPGLRLIALRAALNTLSEDEVRAAAREAFPRLLAGLGAVTEGVGV